MTQQDITNQELLAKFEELSKKVAEKDQEIDKLKKMVNSTDASSYTSKNGATKYIKVISMWNGLLNLSTQPYGAGTVYTWAKFGYDQMIPDNVLIELINISRERAIEGYFYIADPEMVSALGLQEHYKHIISFEDMKYILKGTDGKRVISLFEKASPVQRATLVELIINNKWDNELDGIVSKASVDADQTVYSKLEEIYRKDLAVGTDDKPTFTFMAAVEEKKKFRQVLNEK